MLLAGLAGCYDFSSLSGGAGAIDSSVAADLAQTGPADLVMARDLSGSPPADLSGLPPPDLSGLPPPDLSVSPHPDIAMIPDLAMASPVDLAAQPPPQDLAVSPPDVAMRPADLAVSPPDLAIIPDLATPPDLVPPPDLAVRPLTLSFGAPTQVSTANAYYQLALGDFTGDGNIDVAGAGSGSIGIFTGSGNGSFPAASITTMSPSPQDLAARDLNGDAALDLAIACGNINTSTALIIAMGNNKGGFSSLQSYPVGFWPSSVSVGDVDGNGSPDVVVLDEDNDSIRTFANKGNGTFTMQQAIPMAGYAPSSILVGDWNMDKKGDLAIASVTNKLGNSGSANVLIGNGNGYAAAVDYSTSFGSNNLASGDLNGDGVPDLVTANSTNGNVSVLIGKGDGSFLAAKTYTAQNGSYSVALADFDKDNRLDVACVNRDANSVTVLLGVGDGTLKAGTTIALGVQLGSYQQDIATGDFNADGKPDLVATHPAGKAMLVLLNTSK